MVFFQFIIDNGRYALSLANVERVVRAVEIRPLPKAPDIVIGIINYRGRIIPVLNMRRRFGLGERGLRPEDQFIIAKTSARTVALAVDETRGVFETGKVIVAEEVVPGMEYIKGVVKLDGMVLIHDLDTFLSLEEETALRSALIKGGEALG